MKAQRLVALTIFLAVGGSARAQCTMQDLPCLERLATTFPLLSSLEPNLAQNLATKRSLQPGGRLRAAPGDPEVGRAAAWKTGLWDNLTVHADGTFTETLENQLQTNGSMTRFQLTGVRFVPTVSLTYQANIGQFITARRQARAGRNLILGIALYENEERAKLRLAYSEFEGARAEFLDALAIQRALAVVVQAKQAVVDAKSAQVRACADSKACEAAKEAAELAKDRAALAEAQLAEAKANSVSVAFHKMKAKAIQVLSLVNYSGKALEHWLDVSN